MNSPAGRAGQRRTLTYNPALDGIRAVSVIAVLLYHAGVISGGWIGVEVFFVLSGYLITALLLLELDSRGRIDLVEFWRRRARRLLPGIGLLVVMVAGYVAVFHSTSTSIGRDVAGLLTYTSNWTTAAGDGYWAQFASPSPLRHAWSLAVEEQFYLLFPVMSMVLLRPTVRRWAVPGVTALALIWQVASTAFFSVNRVYLGTDTRAFGLLAGATIAVVLHDAPVGRRRWSSSVASATGSIGCLWLVFAALALSEDTVGLFRGPFQLVVVATAMVLLSVTAGSPSIISRAFGIGPLADVGRWSYGIYLFHWPILLAIEPSVGRPWILFVIVTAITVPFAALSHRYVEQPIRQRGVAAFGDPKPVWFTAALVVAVAGLTATAGADAPPTAADVAARPVVVADGPVPSMRADPVEAAEVTDAARPTVGLVPRTDGRPLRVYVVGDSVGQSIEEALAPVSDELGLEVFGRSAGACGYDRVRMRYFSGDEEPEICTEVIDRWRPDVEAFRPDAVLFVYGSWSGWTHEGRVQTQCEAGLADHVRSLYGLALDDLSASGAPVYFVAPAIWEGNPEGPGSTPDRFRCVRDVMASFVDDHRDRAGFVDLLEEFCVGDRCNATVDGTPIRPDGVHFEGPAAPSAVVALLDQILEPPPQGWPDVAAVEPPT
ncbi:MAG: acyltransferase family protein [Ilumatobacteraceae bacterium]